MAIRSFLSRIQIHIFSYFIWFLTSINVVEAASSNKYDALCAKYLSISVPVNFWRFFFLANIFNFIFIHISRGTSYNLLIVTFSRIYLCTYFTLPNDNLNCTQYPVINPMFAILEVTRKHTAYIFVIAFAILLKTSIPNKYIILWAPYQRRSLRTDAKENLHFLGLYHSQ